jgi:hypothetical protein
MSYAVIYFKLNSLNFVLKLCEIIFYTSTSGVVRLSNRY